MKVTKDVPLDAWMVPKPTASPLIFFFSVDFYKLKSQDCKNLVPSGSKRTTNLGFLLNHLYNECLHSLAPKCYLGFPRFFSI